MIATLESLKAWHWMLLGIIAFAIIYFWTFRKKIARQAALLQSRLDAQARKNHPLLGKIGRVIETNEGQKCKARIAGKVWEVHCKQSLEIDDEVRVRSGDGGTLHVSKLV